MLDKKTVPSFNDLLAYCGENSALWEYTAQTQIRFPYGKSYGWSVKYSKGNKHICDIFTENGTFNVFVENNNEAFALIQNDLSDYAKQVYESKYPCGDGGWVWYKVTVKKHINDAKNFIAAKMKS